MCNVFRTKDFLQVNKCRCQWTFFLPSFVIKMFSNIREQINWSTKNYLPSKQHNVKNHCFQPKMWCSNSRLSIRQNTPPDYVEVPQSTPPNVVEPNVTETKISATTLTTPSDNVPSPISFTWKPLFGSEPETTTDSKPVTTTTNSIDIGSSCPPVTGDMDSLTQNQFSTILTHDCRYDRLTKPLTDGPLGVVVQLDIRHIEAIEQLVSVF